jgi:hypothetical protein
MFALPVAGSSEEIRVTLDALAREGARRMIGAALRAEADEYIARVADELDDHGHRLVVGNGPRPGAKGDGWVGHRCDPRAARERQARR